jgi:hypothetical protein
MVEERGGGDDFLALNVFFCFLSGGGAFNSSVAQSVGLTPRKTGLTPSKKGTHPIDHFVWGKNNGVSQTVLSHAPHQKMGLTPLTILYGKKNNGVSHPKTG